MSSTIYDFSVTTTNGQTIDFGDYRGRPMLVVNTASKCGFTYQYDGLQQLHEQYGPQGLVVIGMPSDQFRQELGDEAEIESFCKINYGVTFPLTGKVDVNGSKTHPVFAFLKSHSRGTLGSSVKWNFTKFLVAGDGTTVRRYGPNVEPAKIAADIEALLESSAA
jgi:glutathione peroxidase